MKIALYILKASIGILLLFLGLYIDFFCIGDGLDPIEAETILFVLLTGGGIALSLLLIRKALRLSPALFWTYFALYLLLFTLPAIVNSVIIILFMRTG